MILPSWSRKSEGDGPDLGDHILYREEYHSHIRIPTDSVGGRTGNVFERTDRHWLAPLALGGEAIPVGATGHKSRLLRLGRVAAAELRHRYHVPLAVVLHFIHEPTHDEEAPTTRAL